MNRLPPLAILLGAAGLIPFFGFGFLSILPAPNAGRVILLIGYGAIILSFLGGVHQGFALLAPGPLPGAAKPAGEWGRAERLRLMGASACATAALAALVAAVFIAPWAGLVTLVAAFVALPVFEQRAVARGWMPRPYMWLRWVLSVVVVLVLAAVLIIRLLGAMG